MQGGVRMMKTLRFALMGLAVCLPGRVAAEWRTIPEEFKRAAAFPLCATVISGYVPPCSDSEVVAQVRYLGAKHLRQDELTKLTNVGINAPVNAVRNRVACQAVVSRLREMGYLYADCTAEFGYVVSDYCCEFSGPDVVSAWEGPILTFFITEGPLVREIRCEGNKAIDSVLLAKCLSRDLSLTREEGTTVLLNPADGDCVISHTLYKRRDKHVVIPGDCTGISYRSYEPSWCVNDDVPPQDIIDASITWPHDLYRVWDIVAADASKIAVLYKYFDYHAARVWCEPQLDAVGIGVTLIYHIEEGPKLPREDGDDAFPRGFKFSGFWR
jgi:hypothetical protein